MEPSYLYHYGVVSESMIIFVLELEKVSKWAVCGGSISGTGNAKAPW